MPRPEPPAPSGSIWSILLATVLGIVLAAGLAFLTGWFGYVLLMGAGVFGLAAFHYLCWGWWLSKVIHDEVAAEEELAAVNAAATDPLNELPPE